MILAIANNKGGVAKTTTAVNLSAALALRGRRVLLVDMDAQCSASLSIGHRYDGPSLASVLFEGLPARDAITGTDTEGLSLLPAHPDLAAADMVLGDNLKNAHRLRDALRPVKPRYDSIIIDCPPSLGILAMNALAACSAFIVPTVPQYLAIEGLAGFLESAATYRRANGGGGLLGILLTLVDYRTRAASENVERVRSSFDGDVFRTEVRVNTRLAEAPDYGQTIFQYDKGSTGAASYLALADELEQRTI